MQNQAGRHQAQPGRPQAQHEAEAVHHLMSMLHREEPIMHRPTTSAGMHGMLNQPGRPQAQPGRPQAQPGRPQAQPGRPQAQPGRHQAQPGRPQAQPGRHQAQPGRPQAQPGRPQAQPGRPQAQPGRHQDQYDERSATEAVHHLMSVLHRAVPEEPTMHRPSISTELHRASPGNFLKRFAKKGHPSRIPIPAKLWKVWKPFEVTFMLLASKLDTTPSPSDELELIQAGLGKRTVAITNDFSHAELSSLLGATFPKMKDLQDRWVLYKAAGGNGRRKMFQILGELGYTGTALRSISGGGKQTLYIVPLQDELDLTPLPADAPEFALMPKVACKHCMTLMPLQMLALHIDQCGNASSSETEDADVELLDTARPALRIEEGPPEESPAYGPEEPQSSGENCFQQAEEVKCPLCSRSYPVSEIEVHANFCGDRFCGESMQNAFCPPDADLEYPDPEDLSLQADLEDIRRSDLDDISCEEDVIRFLAKRIDKTKTFNILVSRDGMVERGLKLWNRRKNNGGPFNPLRVSFLGEKGVDTGALKKEFLSTMIATIEKRLFEGEGEKGKMPKYSTNDANNDLFKAAGEIFAVSLAQGGPAPRFLQEWCYNYLVTGVVDKTDVLHYPLIKEIEDASDLSDLAERIADCGYTGRVDVSRKESIIRAIVLHITIHCTAMLQQLREGLEVYGLIKVMQRKPVECRGLFVVGEDDKADAHYLASHLVPEMSPKGSTNHVKEAKIMDHFQDFLYELEDAQPEDGAEQEIPSVGMVMQWMTGQGYRHLLVSERDDFQITVKFDHNCLENSPGHTVCFPTVSACTDTITLPSAHMEDYESFKNTFLTAMKYGATFDRA